MRITRGTVTDLAKLALTLGLGAVTAVTPRAARPRLLAALTAIWVRFDRAGVDRLASVVSERVPGITREESHEIALEMRATRLEEVMCRGYTVFRADWPAEVETMGMDRLAAAHREGHGVVVWLMSFLEATPFNLAVGDNGFSVTHLSSPTHGINDKGPISRRVVAPVILRGEIRSLGDRVLISRDGNLGYLRRLREVLVDEQGTVTIRGDVGTGRLAVEAPLLGVPVKFPTGAPSLAFRSGAPLLTTATVRLGPFHHQILIDEPIAASRQLDRRQFQHDALQEFAARLEARIRSHPASSAFRREG